MLFRILNARMTYLIIALALVSGCHLKRSSRNQELLLLTPVAQEIERRGYRARESRAVPPTPWEVSTYRMRSKQFFSFRSEQPLPNAQDTYCRFSLAEETYDSVDDARQRLANLHRASPDGPAEEEDYTSNMRAGFRVRNVTYVLQTDASIFWGEVQRLANALATSTQGAELSHLLPTTPNADRSAAGLFRNLIDESNVGCFSPRWRGHDLWLEL
jgi:hypothetical protein